MDKSTRLFESYKRGDEKAFEVLFHRVFPRLFDFASKITKDEAIAGDIIQDAFVKLWRKKDRIYSLNIEAYLFRLVRNQCIDHLKQTCVASAKMLEMEGASRCEELYRIDFVRDEPYLLIRDELRRDVERTINSLPARCREVFILSRLEGLKNREIAEKLKISIKNVERHLTRALRVFRNKFPGKYSLSLLIFFHGNMT